MSECVSVCVCVWVCVRVCVCACVRACVRVIPSRSDLMALCTKMSVGSSYFRLDLIERAIYRYQCVHHKSLGFNYYLSVIPYFDATIFLSVCF